MIQLLNFEPQLIFHSIAIHTVDLSSYVLLFAEGVLWIFLAISVADRFTKNNSSLLPKFTQYIRGHVAGEGLEVNMLKGLCHHLLVK